ncbi:hypothetical protein BN946_scf184895.g15 [Trametes cinnabarina]|uniref:Uncharacterized protein n=1 Tax=Pycnoporus cinnabarinus TaxID=5643 RepID=A0A060SLF9_PYCCI|nr:hypothetical protein BN946_scf184895.g15 [Trametes cinnabarina]
MLTLLEDVTSLLFIEFASKSAPLREVESMRVIVPVYQKWNLADFEKALRYHQLSSDPTIWTHLLALYDALLEQNTLWIVEPYSGEVVEIEYIPQQAVADDFGQGLHGGLDQGRRCLLVFEQPEADRAYGAVIETFEQVGKVVDMLYAMTVKLA